MATLGENIAAVLAAYGWSTRELSRRTGIAPTTLSDVIGGRNQNLTAAHLAQVAAALGVSADDLLAGVVPAALPPVLPPRVLPPAGLDEVAPIVAAALRKYGRRLPPARQRDLAALIERWARPDEPAERRAEAEPAEGDEGVI